MLPPLLFTIIGDHCRLAITDVVTVTLTLLLTVVQLTQGRPLHCTVNNLIKIVFTSTVTCFSGGTTGCCLPGVVSDTVFILTTLIELVVKGPVTTLADRLAHK